jgi:peptidoglycan hydrolase-like protein with peptidoglycan-binding domain
MTRPLTCSVAILFMGLSCSHTQTATDRPKDTGEESAEARHASKPAKDERSHARSNKAEKPRAQDSGGADSSKAGSEAALPLATSPAGLLKPGAVQSIQKALADRGYLSSREQSGRGQAGELDSATRKALRSFQEENHLPATGTPDDGTIRKLGLDAADVFKASP